MSNTVVPVRVSGFGPTPIDMDVPVDLLAPLGRFARGDDVDRRGPAPPRRSRQPGPDGRITALRGTVAGPDRPGPVELFAPALVADDRAATTHGFPFAAVATSGLTAGVAALFFSPVFALFAVVSSLAIVGRWAGAWLARRRRDRRRTEALERAAATWSDTTDRWADAEVRARRAGAPSPAALFALVSGDRSPWSERLDPGADVELVLGRGRAVVDVDVDVADPARGTIDPRSVGLPTGIELVDVPVVAASGDGGGLAVCGDRADVLASARWLVASTAARYGPVDLGIVVVTMADRAVDWDWVKWLPSLRRCHVVDVDGGRQGRQEQWLHRLGDAGPALVVVDGVEPVGASPLARLLAGRIEHSALLWLGDPGEVPGGCRARLDVRADGSGVMRRPDEVRPLQWYGLDVDGVDRVARWLAPFDDPEVRDDGGRLPRSVSIDELLSIDLPAIDGGDVDLDETVRRAWERATPRSLAAPIGVGQDGPESVDLVADGPHALVAGTTGAGKSELLRTLVVGIAALHPPALASFVLIDFKGGGAFDVVADLPHVAAVVTDLDRAEAARALRGLRAELVDREERLREMGCSDVADVDPTHPSSFGRLLVVVDEFAALADELPDFLDGLVDIARRGRSLGVHLVLATQRPSGVVTGQIRSNTNLRICLRVQDRADSMDVIDRPDAADLPPAPGRAFVQRGGQACAPVQVATIAGVSDLATVDRFVVHPALLGLSLPLGHIAHWFEQANGRSMAADASTAEPVVDRISRLGVALGVAPAARPWRASPTAVRFPVSVASLVGHHGAVATRPGQAGGGGPAVLGVLDDPDRRRIVPLSWHPEREGVLIVGVDDRQIASSAAAAVCAVLDRRGPSPAVFVLDGRLGGADVLRELHCLDPVVDIIGVEEPDRLLKSIDHIGRVDGPCVVVINDWQAVAEVVGDVGGPGAVEHMVRLVRRSGGSSSVVVTARSDRDVPQRAAVQLGCRVVHRLDDPTGYLSFGIRPRDLPPLHGSAAADPSTGLVGVVAEVDRTSIAELGTRLGGGRSAVRADPVRVLGARVCRSELPTSERTEKGWRVPIGLDLDLEPLWVELVPARPVLVVGQSGGGRTTALGTLLHSTEVRMSVTVVDDADLVDGSQLQSQLDVAADAGSAVVVASGPAALRRFGSPLADLMSTAVVVALNPGPIEADTVRTRLPDLSHQPIGRVAVLDRGRVRVGQVAS